MIPAVTVAEEMLNNPNLPQPLIERLARTTVLCGRLGGALVSRQVVASTIADYEAEHPSDEIDKWPTEGDPK